MKKLFSEWKYLEYSPIYPDFELQNKNKPNIWLWNLKLMHLLLIYCKACSIGIYVNFFSHFKTFISRKY